MTASLTPTNLKTIASIELFTGAGGLAIATHNAGFRHKALFEWNPDACATLKDNLSASTTRVVEGDVKDASFEIYAPVELVAGGPPCQPFSIGGKHGGNQDRRNMIPQFIRAIRECKPKAFILENVKGLTRQSFRDYFNYTVLQLTYPDVLARRGESLHAHLDRLEKLHTKGQHRALRYNVVWRVLNAADYGVPQIRERVFIVGFRSDLEVEWHFPEATHSADGLLHAQWVTGAYWRRHGIRAPRPQGTPTARVRSLKDALLPVSTPWRTIRDAICDLPEPKSKSARAHGDHLVQPGARAYPGHTGSPIDWASKTLKAGDHGVPGGENTIRFADGTIRYLTVREAARIQTFPDDWRVLGAWTEAMRQLGNAVPVQLAEAVASSVAQTIRACR